MTPRSELGARDAENGHAPKENMRKMTGMTGGPPLYPSEKHIPIEYLHCPWFDPL